MSLALARHRIRLSVDPFSHDGLTCRLQNSTPKIWRGTALYVEVGMYYDGAFVDSVTGITSLHLDILSASDRDGAPLLQKTDASIDTISSADWTGDTDSKYHARFALTSAETQFDMTAAVDNLLSLWFVVHALLTDGSYVTLGAGQVIVEEDGAQNGLAVVTSPSPAYRLQDGELQLWNPDQSKWHTIYIKGAAGAEYLAIGPAEA
jgi:hypothetical protein